MIRLDVSHGQERCGVDVNNNDSVWSFGYRTVRHQMTQYTFLKKHVLYKCKDLTQGACYRRDSCRDSENIHMIHMDVFHDSERQNRDFRQNNDVFS